MNPAFHPVDLFIIFLYLAVLLGLGFFRSSRESDDAEDYLLAGRRLSILPFTASLVATWYGGILGVGEFTYLYGISNWVVFGLPYYVFAFLFAMFIASKIRHQNFTTIPDRFYASYGKGAGILSSIFVIILTSPAPYILSVGILLQLIFNIALLPAVIISTLFSLIYIYKGGFRSVIRTDLLQFALMFGGFILIVIYSVGEFGGFNSLKTSLPENHFSWHGGNSTFYILAWFFIALWTFVDPGFYQRCAAAESPATAKKGIFISILFWAVFDFLTLTTGLYARMILPEIENPLFAIPALGTEILPPVVLGLFFAGLLATIMSTVDSFGLLSAITFGRDLVWKNWRQSDDPVKWTKIGLIVTGIVSLILAWLLPSVVELWYAMGSVVVPGLLIPFLLTFSNKKVPSGIVVVMGLSAFVSLVWFIAGQILGSVPWKIEPFYPGMGVSMVWLGYNSFLLKK